jgi:hypothetical protein
MLKRERETGGMEPRTQNCGRLSALNEYELERRYGRAYVKERCSDDAPGTREKKTTILSSIRLNGEHVTVTMESSLMITVSAGGGTQDTLLTSSESKYN